MRNIFVLSLLMTAPLTACATAASKQIPAVVESESARQAAVAAAQSGATPDEAVAKGEAAKDPT